MIEASMEQARESEKEWYFGNVDKERRGPYSFEEVQSSIATTIQEQPYDSFA